MADERIVIEIDADTGEVVKQFKKLFGKAKDSGKKTGKNFSKGFSSGASKALDGIKGKLISLGAIAAGVFATSVAVRAAADFEKIQTRLETLTGSAAAAGVVFDELKTLSASTPFQLGDIANASAKLISFGFSAGTVADQIKEIGEVAAGSGADLGELSLIFGQIQAQGKLSGERLLQLQERAIPIGPAIAKSMKVAESSVRDLVKEGKVTADEFQKAFTSMTTDGGIFAGSLEKQSKTLSGVFSTLSDNAKIFSSELGNALSPTLIEGANTFIKIFQEAGKAFKANAPVISDNLKKIGDVLLVTPAKFWLNFLAGDAGANLKETNSEISRLQNNLKLLSADLAIQEKSSFSKFFGIDDSTRLSIINTEQEIRKLKTTRDALVAAQPGGANEQGTAAIKAELEAKAVAKGEALKEAEREKARQVSLENLGTTGLAKQEIIEQQLAQELEAIRLAEELKAIDQMGADERRKTVLNNANAQILALQKTAQKAGTIVDKTANSINKSMNQTLGNGVANGIETITKAVMQGENVFKAFGSMVLNMMADMAIQMGKIFVATGIAQLALFSSPGASILAGAALIAAGTVAKSIFGGSDSSSPSGGGVASSSNFVAGGAEDPPAIAQAQEREEPNTEVSVTIQGDVLDSDASGIRIVDIINNAFEKDGVVIKGASFA